MTPNTLAWSRGWTRTRSSSRITSSGERALRMGAHIFRRRAAIHLRLATASNLLLFLRRKATRQIVDSWLVSHANSGTGELPSPVHGSTQPCSSRGGSGATTPVRYVLFQFNYANKRRRLMSAVCNEKTSVFTPPTARPSCRSAGGPALTDASTN